MALIHTTALIHATALTHATASAQARHVTDNLKSSLKNCFALLLLLLSLALDPSIELLIKQAFAYLCCDIVPLLIEFITAIV